MNDSLSIFTLNIAENIPGLTVGEESHKHLINRKPGEAIFYPGKKAERLTNGNLKALFHEVVISEPEKKQDRMAITFFFN